MNMKDLVDQSIKDFRSGRKQKTNSIMPRWIDRLPFITTSKYSTYMVTQRCWIKRDRLHIGNWSFTWNLVWNIGIDYNSPPACYVFGFDIVKIRAEYRIWKQKNEETNT